MKKESLKMLTLAKIEEHKAFWESHGPSLILIPAAEMELYDTIESMALTF